LFRGVGAPPCVRDGVENPLCRPARPSATLGGFRKNAAAQMAPPSLHSQRAREFRKVLGSSSS
jgi:hypothetical protein